MQITASTLSLTVAEVSTSSAFLSGHFGFQIEGADPDGNYASLSRADAGLKIIFRVKAAKFCPQVIATNARRD